MRFDMLLGPLGQSSRLHEEEPGYILFAHLSSLQDRAKQPAVVGQQHRLNHIKVPFGLDVVVVPNPPDAEGLIVLMDNADGTAGKPLDRVFPLKLHQCMPQGSCQKGLIIPAIPVRENGRNRNLDPFILFLNTNAD